MHRSDHRRWILAEKTRPTGLDIYFYDPRKPAQDQPIYWHSSRTRPMPTPAPTQAALLRGPHWADVLKVGDREFGAIYVPTEMFGPGEEKWQAPVALLLGLVIIAMIVFYLLLSMRRTGQLEFLTASLRQMTRELRDEAEKVTHMAHYDAMTGLANRASFNAELERMFAAARRGEASFAVLCFDLDHFKDVNDTLGHAHGDLLLQAVAQRLSSIVRGGDLIGRLGGDEFAIIAVHSTPADEISKLAARVNESLATPFMLEGSEVRVSASIGIAFYSHSTGSPEEMMIKADLALYRSKETGRNRFCVHSADLDRDVQDRAALAGELRVAIEQNQIELLFQPQVDIRSRRIVGMEALARWHHPTRGLLLPAALTRVAEATGVMVPLGAWVLEECCRQIERWRAEYIDVPRIAVNLSAAEIKAAPDSDRDLGAILVRHGIVPGDIEVEITEQGLIETTGHDNLINGLRELGIGIAIDHFGTGCFSIARLRAVGVSRLKIAQEFTRDLCTKPADVAIVHATSGLARELGIEVIADGVETLSRCFSSPPRGADMPRATFSAGLSQRLWPPTSCASGP